MDLDFAEEQELLRGTARSFLTKECESKLVRDHAGRLTKDSHVWILRTPANEILVVPYHVSESERWRRASGAPLPEVSRALARAPRSRS